MAITPVILAAGASDRMGRPKALLEFDGRTALDLVLAGRPVPADQRPSIGCNIKWRAGNEPEYFG